MHPLFFLVAFWAIIVSGLKMKGGLLKLIVAFLPFYIMIATRVRWLPDDPNYYEHWNVFHGMNFQGYLLSMGSGGKFEPGFWLLEQIPSFNATTILISTLYICTIVYVIYTLVPKKYYPFVVSLVFFNPQLATSLSARRTTVAMCLFMIAVILKCKEKRILSIIVAVLSVLFHNTAVFMLPFILLPLNFAEKYLKLVVLGVISVVVLSLLFPGFFNELFMESAEDTALGHYAHYAETSDSVSFAGILQVLFVAAIVGLALLCYTRNQKTDSYSFIFLMAVVYLSLSMLNIGQARIKVYSSLFTFIFIIISYQHRPKGETKSLLILFVLYMVMGYLLWYQKLDAYEGCFSQYSSFLLQ